MAGVVHSILIRRSPAMTRRQKAPLRLLSAEERAVLERIGRAWCDPASHAARAKALLAVADGASYTDSARAAGRRSGDAVSQLVSRCNREGLAAVEPRYGGGPRIEYGDEIITWFEAVAKAWNRNPIPFEWGGKRAARRVGSRQRRHAVGGLGTYTRCPIQRPRHTRLEGWRHACQVTH